MAARRGMPGDAFFLLVDGSDQTLHVFEKDRHLKVFYISTSSKGFGCEEGSNKTPIGYHKVEEWIGGEDPLGTVFKGRKPSGSLTYDQWACQVPEDLILSRILRLRGLDPGVNVGPGVDTFDRYVYIHGTNHEARLGTEASAGCIRMANQDISDLYELTRDTETWVWIGETL